MEWIRDMLTADWWVGVQGIAAVIALTAVAIAAIDFTIRINTARVNAVSFQIERTPSTLFPLRPDEKVRCTITARPMGPTVWYEPEWQLFGTSRAFDSDMQPVMTALDSATITLSIPYGELESAWVGVTWVEPRMLGSRSRGSRAQLLGTRYQRWETFAWHWWPRKKAARWVESTGRTSRLLAAPSE